MADTDRQIPILRDRDSGMSVVATIREEAGSSLVQITVKGGTFEIVSADLVAGPVLRATPPAVKPPAPDSIVVKVRIAAGTAIPDATMATIKAQGITVTTGPKPNTYEMTGVLPTADMGAAIDATKDFLVNAIGIPMVVTGIEAWQVEKAPVVTASMVASAKATKAS